MKIGIIGAGNMGGGLGKLWARAGHEIMFSFSRDAAKLEDLAQAANAKTGTPAEAANFGETVMLAVPYAALEDALQGVANHIAGKTLITCVSGLLPDFSGQTVGLPTNLKQSVAEEIAAKLPNARVVEAFNIAFAEVLNAPDEHFANDERANIFYCGDDATAKRQTAGLIEDCGCEAIDAGALTAARALETLASAWVQFAVAGNLFPRLGLKALRD